MSKILITKRDGSKVDFDAAKINKVIGWACEDIDDVSPSEVAMRSELQLYNKISTKEIHETMIKSAGELITEDSPNYQYVAGRLVNYWLRKEVYGQFQPTSLYDHVSKIVGLGYYTKELLENYTKDEWNQLETKIDHERDFSITYAGMEQFRNKYLVRNRITKQFYETPQVAYILLSTIMFINEKTNRLKMVVDFYDMLSNGIITVPTPILAKLRTPEKQFSSCVLISSDDSIDSIGATNSAILKYVTRNAGIGLDVGKIRAVDSPIRNGSVKHTGVINFIKMFEAAVNSTSQGGIRSGAATVYYPMFTYEYEDLIVLKNNKGTENTRARDLDYCVQINGFLYDRLVNNGDITLFSVSDVPDLYDAFFKDQKLFAELYEKYERSKIRKKTIKAQDAFAWLATERRETGRIYVMNVDNCNTHSSFDESVYPVYQSNLCCEITQHTKPIQDVNDDEGYIALCTLGGVNIGTIKKPIDFEKPCEMIVRALDNLLDYQEYPLVAAKRHTMDFRPLGVGLTNIAYWLAKNQKTYSNPDLDFCDEWFEAFSYYLIKASINLAKERGACKVSKNTKYGNGILPIDSYNKNVDSLVKPVERFDWESLRSDLKQYGIRNSTLMAEMPFESSSVVISATNGIEPIRSYVVSKKSSTGIVRQVAPQLKKLKKNYELLFDIKTPIGYLKICAVMQKYFDQAISVNTTYNSEHYSGGITMTDILRTMILHHRFGGKTLYYDNTYVDKNVEDKETKQEDCESCKI